MDYTSNDEEVRLKLPKVDRDDTEAMLDLDSKAHEDLLNYLMHRVKLANKNRSTRLARLAKIDQMVTTWQKLSPEDSRRELIEDITGKTQALPINLPIAHTHIEDTTSFLCEVFAPVGGNFFAMPGRKNQTAVVQNLVKQLEQDMKASAYYFNVAKTMRGLAKYNFGGLHLMFDAPSVMDPTKANQIESIDVYNVLWDPSINDVSKVHTDGEFAAVIDVKNRVWMHRQQVKLNTINIDKILNGKTIDGQKMNSYQSGKACYYRHPPSQTRMDPLGGDSKSSSDGSPGVGINWESFGLGLEEDSTVDIDGFEVIRMYCWLNPEQFPDLVISAPTTETEGGNRTGLELWEFQIVDGRWIMSARRMEAAVELPIYLARLNVDEMGEAARSLGEHIIPFQRFISFLVNTNVEGVRSALWGLKVYDASVLDVQKIQNGETSGLLASKAANRDVRGVIAKVESGTGTEQNINTAASVMELMKQMFPIQAMPAQIAGMDRAVSSQVSAVMQGSMRKMHMLVRMLDSSFMLAVRMGMYYNISRFSPQKSELKGITPQEVVETLSSGLGQINREAAAEAIRTLIFALIQNPDSAGFDRAGLMTLWSILMNIGTDLGEFTMQQPPMPPNGVDPTQQPPQPGAPPAVA